MIEDSQPARYGVIGGGMLGMTIALRLAQQGAKVTLLESSDHLGGLADAWKLGDTTWDRHYHVTLLSDSFTRGLLKEVGMDDDMQWVETRTGFFTDGRLHSMSSSWEFLMFPPLSLLSKFRLGLTIFVGSRIRDWKALESITVSDWLIRWSGRKVFDRMWLPLLRSKLGDAYKKTSAAFIWATIARLYAARRTGLKKELFGYLPGGYGRFLGHLQALLVEHGVDIRLNHPVESVTDEGRSIVITDQEGDSERFDRVVLTVPSGLVPDLLPQMKESEKARHRAIEYVGIVCVSLLLKKRLAGFYVTNITDGTAPFTGVIEMSAMVDPVEFNGHHLIYLPYYVPEGDDLFDCSDAELKERSLLGLEAMYPEFQRCDLVTFRVSRVPRVAALSVLNYSKLLPPKKTSVRNVFVVNSAQIVNGTLNVNETVRLGEESVRDTLGNNLHCTEVAVPEKQHVETSC